jgi:hypothetical protein
MDKRSVVYESSVLRVASQPNRVCIYIEIESYVTVSPEV